MFDVIIIGSGAAGLTAALNAKKSNTNVLVVSKTYPTHSQTVQAQGGINAVLYEGVDSVDQHVDDTLKASKGLAIKDNIKLMCKEAKETISWLNDIGVPFTRNENNQIAQRKFGGTKNIRTCYSSDYTGLKILHTLYDQCIKEGIHFLNEHSLLNLIIENNKCLGATVLDINTGEIKELSSKSLILASGGYSGIYTNFTTNSYANTGDGIASAIRAGVELSNMEFIQFHPTALKGSNILISESARGEGGYLLDYKYERFIDELKPRDEVSRAIFERISNNENVYLDLRHLGIDKIKNLMPQERRLALEFSNVKLEDELLPINPAAHYSMGGIKTDINCKTNIQNLYACGECAQSSVHGANRLGGNSLLEIVSFGKIAGVNAALNAKENKEEFISNTKQLLLDKKHINSIFKYSNEINFYSIKEEMGKNLFNNVGVFRDEDNMNKALSFINKAEKQISIMGVKDKELAYNKNLVEFLEFINMLEVSKLVIKSAILRKESRGAHFRVDYPMEEKTLEVNTLITKNNNILNIKFEDK